MTILEQGADPLGALRVVCGGPVERVDRGRVVDLFGDGELFGHPSMIAVMRRARAAQQSRTGSP
jgi:signal-transduction protein with cAMP-binding, CBS, and nucleotidyltransferase domain